MNDIVHHFINQPIVSISGLERGSEKLEFRMMTGTLVMEHHQDCCESVGIEDFEGDIEDLVGQVLLEAEEVVSGEAAAMMAKLDLVLGDDGFFGLEATP